MKGVEQFVPDTNYHIVNHAIGNENLFRCEDNYLYFLKKYAYYMTSVSNTLCYCLMPNHIHILIHTHAEDVLEKHNKYKGNFHKLIMQQLSNLLNAYSKSYNNLYNRKGSLWIDNTKRFEIKTEEYLTSAINYIHQNPIKHGFSKSLEGWSFSSYKSLLSDKPTLISRSEVLEWFGGPIEYKKYHEENTVELLDKWEYVR